MGIHACGEGNYQYWNNQFGFAFEFIRSKETINDTINDIIKDSTRVLTSDEKAALTFQKEPTCNQIGFCR